MVKRIATVTSIVIVFLFCTASLAQESKQMVRLARLVIDSTQLEHYHAFLKEEIETSVRVEHGVLTLYAVAEKNNPSHITILEIYANEEDNIFVLLSDEKINPAYNRKTDEVKFVIISKFVFTTHSNQRLYLVND